MDTSAAMLVAAAAKPRIEAESEAARNAATWRTSGFSTPSRASVETTVTMVSDRKSKPASLAPSVRAAAILRRNVPPNAIPFMPKAATTPLPMSRR